MKIGLLQINPVVGDVCGNTELIVSAVAEAREQGAELCIAPELALTGYPPRDLLLYDNFIGKVEEAAVKLAERLKDGPPLLVGSVMPNPNPDGRPLQNVALLLRDGEIDGSFAKILLPSYDVFDEDRYFEPGDAIDFFEFQGKRVAVTICEDVWNDKDFSPQTRYEFDPLQGLSGSGADLLVNLSASPFSVGKQRLRERMLSGIAAKYCVSMAYVNQAGGNDDLIFDGRSLLIQADGTIAALGPAFDSGVLVVDSEGPALSIPERPTAEDNVFSALVLGTRDYVRKCGFKKVLLGLSGGIDSALTAAVAVRALGAENVLGVLMPSPYSSKGSLADSYELAELLGMETHTIPIEPIMGAFDSALADAFADRDADVTEENIQSRIRGNLLMAMSNKYGSMLLTTGNKSELAVGYCTIYGDMSGGLAVISDVPKTLVFSVCRRLNERFGPTIPEAIITKPPSAELRPGQKDEDSLPPYDILDAILELHVERNLTAEEIVESGYKQETVDHVLRLVRIAEFKRRQAAPGLKITRRAFGSGWRMPLACKRP